MATKNRNTKKMPKLPKQKMEQKNMTYTCPNPKCKGNGTTDRQYHHCQYCQEYIDGFTGVDFYKAMKKEVSDK